MTSCQIEDDNSGAPETNDKFVGNWKITQEFEDGDEIILDACDAEDRSAITADYQFSMTSHIQENGICTLEETVYGIWENLGDNTYKISPEDDDLWPLEAKVTFSGNTMTLVIMDEGEEIKQVLTRV